MVFANRAPSQAKPKSNFIFYTEKPSTLIVSTPMYIGDALCATQCRYGTY